MSHRVSSPKQSRIPEKFREDPEVRAYVEYQRQVLYELWVRTGDGFDAVSGKKIINVSVDTVLDNSAYGAIIVVDASAATVQVTLPEVDSHDLGESVIVSVIDASFATTVIPASGTVLGAGSAVISVAYDKIRFSPIDTVAAWIEI